MSARARRRFAAVTAARAPVRGRADRAGARFPLPLLAGLAGLAVAVLVGGLTGVAAGAVVVVAVLRVVPRLEPRAVRRRRRLLEAQAPDLLDLLAACLASGATVPAALAATAEGVGEPALGVLARAGAAYRLGAPPEGVAAEFEREPALVPLAAALRRTADTGAPLAAALPGLAEDLRVRRRAQVEAAARTVGVRLTAPLALTFLPAFVLLGVVPVVAALLASVALPLP